MNAALPVKIRIAETEEDVHRCHPVMVQLRPDLSAAAFAAQVAQQRSEGYQLALLECGGAVEAVAGFRVTRTLVSGLHLYVDDLVTESGCRSQGRGGALLAWLEARARQLGCRTLELDSGVQRAGAHRFYFAHGMRIASFHFRKSLSDPAS